MRIGKKRFLQLRLATVLILMSMAAVGFMLRYQVLEPVYREKAAQRALASIAESTQVAAADYAWQRQYLELEHTTLFAARSGPAELPLLDRIGDLPRLHTLSLQSTGATDRTAAQIGRLRKLRKLRLERTDITDRGLASIAVCRELTELRLGNTLVSDAGLPAIESLTQLESLSLPVGVSGSGLASVAKLPRLKHLSLGESSVTTNHLHLLAGSQIETLDLPGSQPLPGRVWSALSQLPNLKKIEASRSREFCAVSDEHVLEICRCEHLTKLVLSGSKLTDKSMRSLKQLRNLHSLEIFGNLTDASLAIAAEMKSLRTLVIGGRFTSKALNALRRSDRTRKVRATSLVPLRTDDPNHLVRVTPLRSGFASDSRSRWFQMKVLPPGMFGSPGRVSSIRYMTEAAPLENAPSLVRPKKSDPFDVQMVSAVQFVGPQRPPGQPRPIEILTPGTITIQWPAKLNDLLFMIEDAPGEHISFTHASSIEFLGPPHTYRTYSDFAHEWDLAGIDKLKNIQTVSYDGVITKAAREHLRELPKAEKLKVYSNDSLIRRVKEVRIFEKPIAFPQRVRSATATAVSHADQTAIEEVADQLRSENLDSLRLTCVSSADLAPLAVASNLRQLHLDDERGIQALSEWTLTDPLPNLERLYCAPNSMTNDQMRYLKQMPNLQRIELSGPRVTTEGLRVLKDLKNLRYLSLDHKSNATRQRWQGIIVRRPTIVDLTPIGECTQLETLSLWGQKSLGGETFSNLEKLSSLTFLTINDCTITDEVCEHIARCRSLKQIQIGQCDVTDQGLRALATLPSLRHLDIASSKITDAGVYVLARCPSLESLSIDCPHVSPAAWATLKRSKPDLNIGHPN